MKVAFTIATANFLAQAKTVGEAYLAHNPDDKFVICLLDKLPATLERSFFGSIEVTPIEHVGIPFFKEMVDRYSIFELSNSLKPFCAEYLLNQASEIEGVIYLDSDLYVYSSLQEVGTLLAQYNILITPHFFTPLPADGIKQTERHFLNSGLYNGGFFAVKKSDEVTRFLKWWQERMRILCFVDVAKGLFVDQIWLNYVPLYFKGVKLVENPGFNVAYWNLHERKVTNQDGQYLVNDAGPLVFFHFSGYSVDTKEVLAKYQHRYTFENRPELLPLFEDYRNNLLNNKYHELFQIPCVYSKPTAQQRAHKPRRSRLIKLLSRIRRKIAF